MKNTKKLGFLVCTILFSLGSQAAPNLENAELISDSLTFEEVSQMDQEELQKNRIESDSVASCSLSSKTSKAKRDIFKRAVNKLLDINNFENEISLPGQDFILHDAQGHHVTRSAKVGDLIEIQLPMDPTLRTYWVKIEKVTQTQNELSIMVRPTANPRLAKKKSVTDHFFTNAATNNFSVSLTHNKLTARIHGLNEEANTTQVRSWRDAAANVTIATMAWGFYRKGKAIMGLQTYTWKSLTTSLADCN